jgi:HSP20 family protein
LKDAGSKVLIINTTKGDTIMTMVRFNNRHCAPAGSYYDSVSPWINRFWSEIENGTGGQRVPPANIVATPEDYRIELSVPGFAKSDFSIRVENQVLKISVEQAGNSETAERNYVRHEFSRDAFDRSFRLSAQVDSSNILARYENGILEVVIPKVEEAKAKPARDIQVD